ncbi:Telomerase reverse transcriptase [Mycena indigotica]|uniref:Telomerase reverse transcriptase n=1 Tax=Mycena indigotica TaxID=2126181 RepID=A0A8H6VYG3_9AGAR|nr:Telomerase reverse transcriptase [Mycena indigotica]KAF7292779.1 Telomerase reverse transcriptase [Mycena indigotica]
MPGHISRKLLGKYYSTVKSLGLYLTDILDVTPSSVDYPPYTTLLATSVVCHTASDDPPRLPHIPPDVGMDSVIQSAIVKLLSVGRKKCRNILAQGYILNVDGKEARNVVANTNVTALQAPEWELLHQQIGTDAMMHLLTRTCIFVALPNDCFCQLVGVPITVHRLDNLSLFTDGLPARPPKRTYSATSDDVAGPAKRVKLNDGTAAKRQSRSHIQERSASTVILVRNRLFYGRVMENGRTNGLPPSHILNKLKFRPPNNAQELDPNDDETDRAGMPNRTDQMKAARRLSKYVFPRQYGLESPFGFESQSTTLPDFSNRDHHITALGPCKTPKRLKEAVPLLEKVIWRHGKCQYWQLRDLACPSEARKLHKKGFTKQDILAFLADRTSSLPRSQPEYNLDASYDTDGNTIAPIGLTQAKKQATLKPHLAEIACSHKSVFRYVMLVTKVVFPTSFWGSHTNFLHVMKKVKTFISCRRYETLSLHNILQGFSTSACDWLMPPGPGLNQKRVPVTDSLKRREILEEFIFWYFDSFLMPLLKTTFYVTESSALRNHVLYFRQDDWAFMCAPLIKSLTSATYQKISNDEAEAILQNRTLGYSFVRLLPKEAGVRPITNLKRKQKITNERGHVIQTSINQTLQACFRILNYERDVRRELVGASIFNINEVYSKLKEFKKRLPKRLPKLYFVKVDVQACFDTIPQTKLIEILRALLSKDNYTVQRYAKVTSEAGKVRRAFLMRASAGAEDDLDFLQTATKLAGVLHSTIFVDEVRPKLTDKADVLHLLEQHITENIVKIGADYHRQTIGIPQGSVLSSLLCAFFYGDLEKRFSMFTDDPYSMLIRQTDDYLFVSTDKAKARGFLDTMNKGHPEYGCFISADKTVTNFDVEGILQEHYRYFPWCGLLIDTKHLTVSVEYARYSGMDLSNTLTIGRGATPGATFRYKMLQLAKNRCHIIYNDIRLNTEHVVYANIYENFLLCALKMHFYLRGWGLDTRKHARFLWETIRQMINYCYHSITNKSATTLAARHGGRANVDKSVLTWLGSQAFHAILSKRPTRYAEVIKRLKAYNATPRGQRYARRFRKLTTVRYGQFLRHFDHE